MTNECKPVVPVQGKAARQLLDREPPRDYVQEWTERIAAEAPVEETDPQTVFIFRVGREWLALPAHVLQEVGERSMIHSLPHRRSGVLSGLTSVRGELLLCISLEQFLHLEKMEDTESETRPATGRMLVACGGNGERVAIPADEVHGLHRYHPGDLRPVPATLSCAAHYMLGVIPWDDRTAGYLEEERLFQALDGALS